MKPWQAAMFLFMFLQLFLVITGIILEACDPREIQQEPPRSMGSVRLPQVMYEERMGVETISL